MSKHNYDLHGIPPTLIEDMLRAALEHYSQGYISHHDKEKFMGYDLKIFSHAPQMYDKLEVCLDRLKEKNNESVRDIGLIDSIERLLLKVRG